MPKVEKPTKQTKRATNLTLDPEAIARGEEFGAEHGTSLSKLVTSFLYALPDNSPSVIAEFAPPVQRLLGVAAKGRSDREDYRAYLDRKYDAK